MTEATNDLYIVEPDSALRKDDKGLVARALMQGSKYVQLRLLNVTDEPKIIRKSTSIATLSLVKLNITVSDHEAGECYEHLKDLYEEQLLEWLKSRKKR